MNPSGRLGLAEAQLRLRQLHDVHADALVRYLARRVDRPEDAADVLAEVFVVAWRRLDVVPEGDEARLWLFGVARRVLANHRRGLRRRRRLTNRLAGELATALASTTLPPATTGDWVREAVGRLSERDAEVVRLWAWEDLSTEQIAMVLDLSPGAVRTRLHRARRRLAVILDASEQDRAREARR